MDPSHRRLELVLLHELSSGTFARLYLAEARGSGGIDRIVAVKLLRDQWNESTEVLARTRDEARLLARLRHKNIVRVEELTEFDGQLAIIMEFVDGLDLRQLQDALRARGMALGPRAALQVSAATAAAIAAAYERVPLGLDAPLHVVHRDIKPSNIMVSCEGEVKVLDFGTARSTQALRSAQTGALRFGSLKYMSPERREGDRGEHPADVYALGLVLLELFRGESLPLLPMDAVEHDAAIRAATAALPALGMPNAEWDAALRRAIEQLCASSPEVRPSAEQASQVLRAFADAASGPTLETFAADVVTRLTREVRGATTGGQLSGTRFVVNLHDSGSSPKSPPAAPPTPVVVAETGMHPRHAPPLAPETVQAPARPVAPAAPMTAAAPAAPFRPVVSPDSAPPAAPPGPVARAPTRAVIALGAVAFVSCLGAAGAGAAWWLSGSDPAPADDAETAAVESSTSATGSTTEQPPPQATASDPAAESAAGAVRIAVDGPPARWIRLERADGSRAAEGRDALDAQAAAGDYTLSVSVVGRPPMRAQVTVTPDGLSLTCTPTETGGLSCAGAPAPILLLPG
jgi:serine/threonine protein kinase